MQSKLIYSRPLETYITAVHDCYTISRRDYYVEMGWERGDGQWLFVMHRNFLENALSIGVILVSSSGKSDFCCQIRLAFELDS